MILFHCEFSCHYTSVKVQTVDVLLVRVPVVVPQVLPLLLEQQ